MMFPLSHPLSQFHRCSSFSHFPKGFVVVVVVVAILLFSSEPPLNDFLLCKREVFAGE